MDRRKGGCFCGYLRYEVDGAPFNETVCHCSICRRTTGAPFVAWFSVSRGRFRFVSGEPKLFRSSDHGTRGFCPQCGAQITFQDDAALHEIDVTSASLDDPEALAPKDHIWTASRLDWVKLADGLPEHRERRA